MQCTVCLLGEGTVRDHMKRVECFSEALYWSARRQANDRDAKTGKERLQGTELFIVVGWKEVS